MAEITALMVKDLREKTGAGFGECKKALVDSEGNIEKAIEFLRKKGAASAAKRSEKSAKEGIVAARISADEKTGILVEVNCETDFVAKNEGFVDFVETVLNEYLNNEVKDIPELMALKVGNDTIKDLYDGILAKFSEKIEISRIFKMKTAGFISAYNHFNKNLAVLVEGSVAAPSEKDHEAIHDTAMQIAALNPIALSEADVPESVKESEYNIAVEKTKKDLVDKAVESALKKAGINANLVNSEEHIESNISKGWLTQEEADKAREIIKTVAPETAANISQQKVEAIAKGRLAKYFKESCLLDQEFSKDASMNIETMLKNANPELKIVSFKRFFIGEDQKD